MPQPLPARCNDGSGRPPRLVPFLNLGNLEDLPAGSDAPTGSEAEVLAGLREAGFEGVQGASAESAAAAGLRCAEFARVNQPGEIADTARRWADAGVPLGTLHVGWGMETDAEIDAIVDDLLAAEDATGVGIYVETHRSTITQDCFRTVELLKRRPRLGINGDFSHWYTGLEMPYAGMDAVCDFIGPVFERVRFLHGRIGNSGCIQVDAGRDVAHALSLPHVQDFATMWTHAFRAFKQDAQPGDWLGFAPELLKPSINYARLFPDGNGGWREECDRWQQALLYRELALQLFEAA